MFLSQKRCSLQDFCHSVYARSETPARCFLRKNSKQYRLHPDRLRQAEKQGVILSKRSASKDLSDYGELIAIRRSVMPPAGLFSVRAENRRKDTPKGGTFYSRPSLRNPTLLRLKESAAPYSRSRFASTSVSLPLRSPQSALHRQSELRLLQNRHDGFAPQACFCLGGRGVGEGRLCKKPLPDPPFLSSFFWRSKRKRPSET